MKHSNMNIHDAVAKFPLIAILLFAGLCVCEKSAHAQADAPKTTRVSAPSTDSSPERVELGDGRYKNVYRNSNNQIYKEEIYEGGGILTGKRLVQTNIIEEVYPDGKPAKVTVNHLGIIEGRALSELVREQVLKRLYFEEIEYDPEGNIRQKITRTDCTGGGWSPVRIVTTYPPGYPGGINRIQRYNDKISTWETLPGQPSANPPPPQPAANGQVEPLENILDELEETREFEKKSSTKSPTQTGSRTDGGKQETIGSAYARLGADGKPYINVSISGDQNFDQLKLKLPSKANLSPVRQPRGWKSKLDSQQAELSGPQRGTAHLRLLMNSGGVENLAGKQIEVTKLLDGKSISKGVISVTALPPLKVSTNLEEHLVLPPEATPGQPFLATNLGEAGVWQFSVGNHTYRLPTTEGGSMIFNLPGEVKPGTPLRFTFMNIFGETLVEAESRQMSIANFTPATEPAIQGGVPRAFAGQTACIIGRFPSLVYVFNLSLDRKQPLEIRGASPTSTVIALPPDVTPGKHTIEWSCPDASATGKHELIVLGLTGSIDTNKLWTGQSTTMRLRVLGTEEALKLKIKNNTPGIIELEGVAAQQDVTTSGGADNKVEKGVRGISKGNFSIEYSLDHDACGRAAGEKRN